MEQSDPGNARRTPLHAGSRILPRYTSEREDWYLVAANGPKCIEPGDKLLRFFKHRAEYHKIRPRLLRSHDLALHMARHGNDRNRSSSGFPPDFTNILGRYVVGSKMNSVSAHYECDIGPRVDQ